MNDLDSASDADLLHAWTVDQDQRTLAVLQTRYWQAVYDAAFHLLRNSAMADDVVQETFIEMAAQSATLVGPIAGWLRGVAGHIAISHLRSHVRRRHRELAVAQNAPTITSNDSNDDVLADLVGQCVAALPASERDLIVRIFWEGATQKDIAKAHAVTPAAIHKRTQLALERVRRLLCSHGLRVTAATIALSLSQLGGTEGSAITGWAVAERPATHGSRAFLIGATLASAALVALVIMGGIRSSTSMPPEPMSLQPIPGEQSTQAIAPDVPAWCTRPVVAGWSGTNPSDWSFVLCTPRDWADIRPGHPALKLDRGTLSFRPSPSDNIYVGIPITATREIGQQVRLHIRFKESGRSATWLQTVLAWPSENEPHERTVIDITSVRDDADPQDAAPLIVYPTREDRWNFLHLLTPSIGQRAERNFTGVLVVPSQWHEPGRDRLKTTIPIVPFSVRDPIDITDIAVRTLTGMEQADLRATVRRMRPGTPMQALRATLEARESTPPFAD